jgi:acyl-CoA thioester hydrolase
MGMAEAGAKHITDFTADPRWLDYNGHMNIAYYTVVLDEALEAFFTGLGIGEDYAKEHRRSMFMLQNHTHYLGEILEGQRFGAFLYLLGLDKKRFHAFLSLRDAEGGRELATSEFVGMHVDLDSRKAVEFPPAAYEGMAALLAAQKELPGPKLVGHSIGLAGK